MKKFLLGNQSDPLKNSYVWNTLGGMLNAGQSALLLIVISRTNSVEDAGIFSIAYAIACLTVTVGKWGMRNFQVTDVQEKYSYSIYVSSRVITCTFMILLTMYYIFKGVFFSDYTTKKCMVILLLGLLKMLDSIEDIVHGLFQRKGRLDIGAKSMATRYMLLLAVCSVSLYTTHNLIVSLVVSLVSSFFYFIFATTLVFEQFKEKVFIRLTDKRVRMLLAECFSLFVGSFLMIYIANAPKYAIDNCMNETAQACFNYIFMPVYVISVLNTFIYQPVLTNLAICYEEKKYNEFISLFLRQLLVISGLAFVILLCAYWIGIPILSFLYNIDLTDYKLPFMVLMSGSIFLAIAGYVSVAVTILRKQNWLLIGYILTAIIDFLLAKPLVLFKGIIGASFLYTGVVLLQAVIFTIIFIIFYKENFNQ